MAPETDTAQDTAAPIVKENFADLLEESLGEDGRFEGRVVKGTIIAVENNDVLIDVCLKSEGRVPLKEFGNVGEEPAQGIHDGRKGCRLDVHGLRLPVWQLDILATSVRFARAPHPQQLILRQDARDIVCELQRGMAELRDGTLLIAMVWLLEPSLRIVAAEPCFEDGRMLVALGDGYLVREEAVLERLVVKLRRQTPAFGTNEDDQRPTSFRARPSIASFLLDCKDLGVGPDVARVSFER